MSESRELFDRIVKILQWGLVGMAALFIFGIIVWIGHLIRTAWWLHDTPSASIGISLVAIPIFLTLLGVVLYIGWGLIGDRNGR